MKFNIKERIWGSFLVLTLVFVINGIMTIVTLNKSKKLSLYISTVIDPMQQNLQDFKAMIVESKMYSTNWVFLRYDEDDKNALRKLHNHDYPEIRKRITALLPQLENKKISDSLQSVFIQFEHLMQAQQNIMSTLSRFEDYDNVISKMNAEQVVEDEIIPHTAQILVSLNKVALIAEGVKDKNYTELEKYSISIRVFITILSFAILALGIFLSLYFTKIITHPISKIKEIINGLGRGIINKVDYAERNDEIGAMVSSVNNLSGKLQETAKFAQAVGDRNFSVAYTPLSDQDILGKALLTMRDNIKTSEEHLLKTSSNLLKRNQALEQYTFIVSHNLRAPVATILGLSELLGDDMITPEAKQLLDGLHTSARKLDNVIHDLNHILEVKHQVHELVTTVSLQALVNELKNTFSKVMSNGDIELKCDFTDVNHITTIKSYLLSILYNLISNSIKYRRSGIPLLIEIRSYKENENTVIVFRDNGKGMDMEKNGKKLFGLYQRFDLTVEGKGMGLFMIKTQVENLDGNISVQSEIDKGTEFRIELPNIQAGNLL